MSHYLESTQEFEELSNKWEEVWRQYDVDSYTQARLLEWAVLGHCPFAFYPDEVGSPCVGSPPGHCGNLNRETADRCGPLMVLHYKIPNKYEEVMT